MLPRAVHPYRSAIQKQRKLDWTQVTTTLQVSVIFYWVENATDTHVGLKFEPCNTFARCATGFKRISVRSTVRTHFSYQRSNRTHRTTT
ncbi:MAG: hypothetical protein EZS28_018202, partial [Streblomastix strix]